MLRLFRSAFTPATSDVDLLRSQVHAFRRQIPMMYFIVCVNTIALAWTHYGVAPPVLTLAAPAALVLVSLLRLAVWWRIRTEVITDEVAARTLRSTVIFAGVLGAMFTVWALALFPYGDAYSQMHVAFTMAVSLTVGSMCLTHLRSAAFVLIAIATVPFVAFFGRFDEPVMRAISINILLVGAGLVVILTVLYQDFESLIASKRELQRKQAELEALNAEVERLANTDMLTGLPNRRSFFAEVERRLAATDGAKTRVAIGVLDLDGFKPINDAFGHVTGDRVLVEIAGRLRALEAAGVMTARLGGDEFGIMVTGSLSDDGLRRTGEMLCDAVARPYEAFTGGYPVSASLGFASFPRAGVTGEELYECADFALYHAKRHARGTTVVFDETHEPNIRQLRIMLQARRNIRSGREAQSA